MTLLERAGIVLSLVGAQAASAVSEQSSFDDVQLRDETVLDARTVSTCDAITVGPNVVVGPGGALHLEAGSRIVMGNDVLVARHGTLSAETRVLLRDDFEDAELDGGNWFMPEGVGTFFGRTQLRPASEGLAVDGGVLRLRLDTHNPTALVCGDSFWGSEIVSHQLFDRGSGLVFEARSRFVPLGEPAGVPLPGGIVGSLFSFALVSPTARDEIDFELLSNDVIASRERVLTNVFDDDGFDTAGLPVFVSVPGLDLTQFNVFQVTWLPDRIRFEVNGTLVREELHTIPDAPMSVRLNVWAPDALFTDAYDPALQPDCDPADNRTFYYEVDYVEVRSCPP